MNGERSEDPHLKQPETAAWLALAVRGRRQHGGNDGYDDNPQAWYSWDSTVGNRAEVSAGDIIALWDKRELVGVSVIDQIKRGQQEKERHRCPCCRMASFKARETISPRFLCFKCGRAFDDPVSRTEIVTTYRSHHEAAWCDLPVPLLANDLRRLCSKPRSQNSIRRLRVDDFLATIEGALPHVTDLLSARAAAGRTEAATLVRTQRVLRHGHTWKMARVRLGQKNFRADLLAAYGEVCAFSGPTPGPALEAAHLYSYALSGRHEDGGGFLLRRDLHSLFDLGDITVNPATFLLHVRQELRTFDLYAALHGRPLQVAPSRQQADWLANHWQQHRRESPTPSS